MGDSLYGHGSKFVDGWNEICGTQGLPKVAKLTKDRKDQIRLRLKDHPETEFWQKVLNKIPDTNFLTGKNDQGWRADIDWLIKNEGNAVKILEGRYDDVKKRN